MNEHSLAMVKKEIIEQAALKLIVERGLYDAPISLIAKEAQVPVGSVYTYYESKEILVNEIYRNAKRDMSQHVFASVPPDLPIKEEMAIYWVRAVRYGVSNPNAFYFMEQLTNSPHISPLSQEQVRGEFVRVFQVLEKGIETGEIKPLNVDLLHQLVYTNIIGIVKYLLASKMELDPTLEVHLFNCCWDTIKC
ncbi:MAG: TetR/AcrR family transcriptional regulator [Bacteroidetes bacterium]|nr:TetR/AcrR family transcriptional regulator [Bacteroidota bacterium]